MLSPETPFVFTLTQKIRAGDQVAHKHIAAAVCVIGHQIIRVAIKRDELAVGTHGKGRKTADAIWRLRYEGTGCWRKPDSWRQWSRCAQKRREPDGGCRAINWRNQTQQCCHRRSWRERWSHPRPHNAVGIGIKQPGDAGLQIADINMETASQRIGDQIGAELMKAINWPFDEITGES